MSKHQLIVLVVVGAAAGASGAAEPDATAAPAPSTVFSAPGAAFFFPHAASAFGEEVAIAKIAPAATIGQVHWNPPAGKGPTLTKRPPTIDPANEGDEEFEDEGSE